MSNLQTADQEVNRRLNIPYQFDAQPVLVQIDALRRDKDYEWATPALDTLERGIVAQGYVTGAQLAVLESLAEAAELTRKTNEVLLDPRASRH